MWWLLTGLALAAPELSEAEGMAFASRAEAIERVKGLLAQGHLEDQRPELLLRLGEMLMAHGRQIEGWEQAAFQVDVDRCYDDPDCDPASLVLDRTPFEGWYVSAERAYNALQHFPRYERADEAAWYHADVLRALSEGDAGHERLLFLVRSFPSSELVPQAYTLIGDHLLDDGVVHKALVAYRRATRDPEGVTYAYALRRLAFCQFQTDDVDGAIRSLQEVVALEGEVHDEAIDDLVRIYADADRLNDAEVYFTSLGRPELVRPVLMLLADRAEDNGQVADAIHARRTLILRDPMHEGNAEQQRRIAKAYRGLGVADRALAELVRLFDDFSPESPWGRSHPDGAVAAMEGGTTELRRLAADQHARARKLQRGRHTTEAAATQGVAGQAYELALTRVAGDPDLRFGLGELRYEQGRFADARDHYIALVRAAPDHRHAQLAAESAVHAAERGVGEGQGPWTDADARLVEACDVLVQAFPDSPKVRDAEYKSGHLLYRRGRVVEAADRFERVIAADPRSREARLAAHLILDALALQEDWGELERRAGFFASQDRLGTPAFRGEVRLIEERAAFEGIEVQLAADRDHGAAGTAMVAWLERFGASEEADVALHNAATWFSTAGRFDDMVAARERLLALDATGVYAQEQVARLGWARESVAEYPAAATLYGQLRDAWLAAPSDRLDAVQVADASHSAAVLWGALGERERAVAAYESFVAAFPHDGRVPDARLSVARLFGELGRSEDAANAFAAFVAAPGDADSEFVFFARVRQGRALEDAGRWDEARRVYEATAEAYRAHVASGGAAGASTTYAAEAMVKLTEPGFEAFAAIELIGTGAATASAEERLVQRRTLDKIRSLETLRQSYQQVIELGTVRWSLAALVKVGEAQQEMARALRAAPCLRRLTEAQCAAAMRGQEDLALLAEERSADAYTAVVRQAAEVGYSDPQVRRAAERLAWLRPEGGGAPAERLPEVMPSSGDRSRPAFETSL